MLLEAGSLLPIPTPDPKVHSSRLGDEKGGCMIRAFLCLGL